MKINLFVICLILIMRFGLSAEYSKNPVEFSITCLSNSIFIDTENLDRVNIHDFKILNFIESDDTILFACKIMIQKQKAGEFILIKSGDQYEFRSYYDEEGDVIYLEAADSLESILKIEFVSTGFCTLITKLKKNLSIDFQHQYKIKGKEYHESFVLTQDIYELKNLDENKFYHNRSYSIFFSPIDIETLSFEKRSNDEENQKMFVKITNKICFIIDLSKYSKKDFKDNSENLYPVFKEVGFNSQILENGIFTELQMGAEKKEYDSQRLHVLRIKNNIYFYIDSRDEILKTIKKQEKIYLEFKTKDGLARSYKVAVSKK